MSEKQLDFMTDIVAEMLQMSTEAQRTGDWRRVNDALSNAQFAINNTDMELTAVRLRCTAVFKHNLSSWTPLLHRAIETAKMQGLKVDEVFYGLMAHD